MKLTIWTFITLALCLRVEGSAKTVPGSSGLDGLLGTKMAEVKNPPEAQRKRDAGYSYPRPLESSRPRLVETWTTRGRPTIKASGQSQAPVRPFTRYGPPRAQLPQRNENGDVHVTVNGVSLAFVDDGRHQRVPSLVRENEFAGASPIASQNNVPFGQNSANYLPPRNQKLPIYSSAPVSTGFSHQHRHHQASAQQQHHHHNSQPTRTSQGLPVRANSQISDGVNFLSQNSQAIEQLYDAPAINVNYEPIHEPQPSRDLQSLEIGESAGSYQENGDFRLPGYASGVLDGEALVSVKSLEKDRLINELRQSLAAQQPTGGFPRDDRNRENPENRGACAPASQGSFVPMTPGYQYVPAAPSSPGTSGSSVVPATSPQDVTTGQATTGQTGTSVSATSTTNNNFQFPNFGALVPVTSYLDYPAYGTGFLASGTSGHVQTTSPTQFGIPIPQGIAPAATKPPNSGTPGNPLPVQPLHPVLGTTASFNPATLHPSFPLVPAVGQTSLAHPVHGVQVPVNPLLVKPVKPVYPLYYYPNVYQLQKPGLANAPWNYAPSYSPVRPDQAWK